MSDHAQRFALFSVHAVATALFAALSSSALAQEASVDGIVPDKPRSPLDEIVVVASKVDTPLRRIGAAVSSIDAAEIELRGYFSIADVLRTQPGIAVSTNGGPGTITAVRIRGEESFRTQAYIDGIKIVDPSAPQALPNFDNFLATNDMQRIEILRGPQGFIYGADAGGVVSISTRRGAGPLSGRLAAEAGSFGSQRLEGALSGGNETADFFVSVTDLSIDGFNTRPSDNVLVDDDGYDNTIVHGKFGWNATEQLRLQLVARTSEGETSFDGCGFPSTADCLDTSDETAWRASADLTLSGMRHALAVSQVETDRQSFADGFAAFGSEGELTRVEYTGTVELSEIATVVFGVDHQEEDAGTSGDALDRTQTGVYFEYQGILGDGFYYALGARYDDNDDFGSFTSVRASAAYVTDIGTYGTLKYRTSIGTGFRAPSLFELAYNSGPFAFPPAAGLALAQEETQGYDIGVDWVADSGATLGIGWFEQDVDNAILFDLVGFSGYLQDTGTSTSEGIELTWDVPLDEHWTLLGNATWNETETPEGPQRIRRPEWYGNLGVQYRGDNDRLRVIANLRSAQDAVDEIFGVGRVDLDNFAVLDLSAAYAVNDALTVYGRVNNATDEDFQEVIDFDNGGRAAFAGFRFTF